MTMPAGLLLVLDGILSPVVSVSAMTKFPRYIYYCNLQFLTNGIIIKTRVLFPQVNLAGINYPYVLLFTSRVAQ